jgi:transcriptional regulator with XRE-family HTH domain
VAYSIKLGARLRAARKAAGFKTSKEFIKKYKVPASTYSQHESGARSPDDETIKFYSKALTVNLEWLKNGSGQPFSRSTATQKNVMDEELLDISDKATNKTLDQKLLVTILDGLIELSQSLKGRYVSTFIAKHTITIYSEVIRKHTDINDQLTYAKKSLITLRKHHKA